MAARDRLQDAVTQLVLCLELCEAELAAVSHRLSEEFSRRPFQQTVGLPLHGAGRKGPQLTPAVGAGQPRQAG